MQEVEETDLSRLVSDVAAELGRESVERLLAQQEAIAQIGQRALEGESLSVLMAEACELVRTALGAEFVSVLELEEDGKQLRVEAGVGWTKGVVGTRVPADRESSLSGYTLATRGTVIVDDLAS